MNPLSLNGWLGKQVCSKYKRKYRRNYQKFIAQMKKSIPIKHEMFSKEIIDAYRDKWAPIEKNCGIDNFLLYSSHNGKADLNYIPDYLYDMPVRRILSDYRMSNSHNDKNSFELRLSEYKDLFPHTLFRRIRGVYYDRSYGYITSIKSFLASIEEESLIAKVAIGTGGGADVHLFHKDTRTGLFRTAKGAELLEWADHQMDFIVQIVVKQNAFFCSMNESSINTIRVVTYRSVVDESIHVTHSLVRVGTAGSFVDNWHSGGIIVGIGNDGVLRDHGFDGQFRKVAFSMGGRTVPMLSEIHGLAKSISRTQQYHRMVSYDFYIDEASTPRLMEINYGVASWLQIVCGPLFGNHADKVIEYCKHNKGTLLITVPVQV